MARPLVSIERSFPERLLDAAEDLLGRYGLDGVSMRQIRVAAGTANKSAIQYHFGDLDGLIRAVLARRMVEADRIQALLLDRLESEGRLCDSRSLLDLWVRPPLQSVNENGERVWARFLVAVLNSRTGTKLMAELKSLAPTIERVQSLLRAAHPGIPPLVLDERLRLMTSMILCSAFNRVIPVTDKAADSALIDDALDVAALAISAPIRDRLRKAVNL